MTIDKKETLLNKNSYFYISPGGLYTKNYSHLLPKNPQLMLRPAECRLKDYSRCSSERKITRPFESPITQATENSPVEVDQAQDFLPECSNCFGDGYVEDEFGRVEFCQCEPKLSRQKTQCAIAPAAEKSPGVEVDNCVYCTSPEYSSLRDNSYKCYRCEPDKSDRNPVLTGIPLSDMFVSRYSPPQSEIVHFHSDVNGQLSLLDFEVESVDEPPDPDDFDSIFEFWAAYDAWVADDSDELPRSEDNDASSQDKPLEVSLDSFCEWAPCPDEWYEPAALLEQSKVSELSLTCKSSITSDFFIPTFGRWGDRPDRRDEPPDTGIFVRLPKPKPPNFPPQASQPKSAQISISQSGIPKLSRNYPETIPKLFHRVVACSSTQPARSPPGGDA